MPDVSETTLVGRPPTRSRKTLIAFASVVLAALVWAVLTRRYFFLLYSVMYGFQLLTGLRPATVVWSAGIRRPWTRRSWIDWNEVISVSAPQPGRPAVRVNLINGKSVALANIASDQAGIVAAIGGMELVSAATVVLKPPLPPPRPPSDEALHADVQRRAADLSAGWKRLAEESSQIHRPK